jgi:hypothetical protein
MVVSCSLVVTNRNGYQWRYMECGLSYTGCPEIKCYARRRHVCGVYTMHLKYTTGILSLYTPVATYITSHRIVVRHKDHHYIKHVKHM